MEQIKYTLNKHHDIIYFIGFEMISLNYNMYIIVRNKRIEFTFPFNVKINRMPATIIIIITYNKF